MAREWMKLGLALTVVAILAGSAAAADVSAALAQIGQSNARSLAVFRGNMTDEMGTREVIGPAFCIKADPPIFISLALDARVKAANLTDFRLIPAGQPDKQVKAELLGIDPETNITFIKATEPYEWVAVQFARTSSVAFGQPVFSVGLWPLDTGYQPYLGMGYVASFIRVPEQQVYVTGGALTNVGTPVFNAEGVGIGIVGSQRFMNYQMMLSGRAANVGLKSQQESNLFLPVEEFAHVLDSIPASPSEVRRLPWMGIISLQPVSQSMAEVLSIDQPGVMIDNLVPGQPADKAGLLGRDVIIAYNGEPLEKFPSPDMVVGGFTRKLMRAKPGDTVQLTVVGNQGRREVSVTLDPLPQLPEEATRHLDRRAGMLVRDKIVMDQYVSLSGSANVPGVVIVAIVDEMPAAKAGLQANDLIASIDNKPVADLEAYKQVIAAVPVGATVNFLIRRGSVDSTVQVQLPAEQQPQQPETQPPQP